MATTLSGNTNIASPYTGAQPITITRTGVPVGEWVEAVIPVNIVTGQSGTETATQHWSTSGDANQGWRKAGADGTVQFVFNASVNDEVVGATVANGWVLPSGTYQITTKLFSDKTGASVESANFTIGGDASAAIKQAGTNKGKKK